MPLAQLRQPLAVDLHNASRSKGRCGTTMFVHKGDGFTARRTIRFRTAGA